MWWEWLRDRYDVVYEVHTLLLPNVVCGDRGGAKEGPPAEERTLF